MEFVWLIIALAVVVYAGDRLFSYFALKRVAYMCRFEREAAFEGESVRLIEQLINDKPLPILWLKVRLQMPLALKFENTAFVDISDKQYYQRLFSLLGYQQVTCRHVLNCIKRGYYVIDDVDMISGDILSGRRCYERVPMNMHFLVYPRFIDVDDVLIPARLINGDMIVKRWIIEDPFQIAGFRDYMPTDSLNKINWLATARQQRLQVIKHDFTASSSMIIMLNVTYKSSWVNYNVLEQSIRLCASLAREAVDNGIPVAVISNGLLKGYDDAIHMETPLGCSNEHMTGILEDLARLTFEYEDDFSVFLNGEIEQIPYNADILILTSYIDDDLAAAIVDIDKSRISVRMGFMEDVDWERYELNDVDVYTITEEGAIK